VRRCALEIGLSLLHGKQALEETSMSTATIVNKSRIVTPAVVPVTALKGLIRKPAATVAIAAMNKAIAARGATAQTPDSPQSASPPASAR
jgi:hypothetical protein